MIELELEKTYLAKFLPKDVAKFPHKEVSDIYIPANAVHPTLRIRKKGDTYEMTKKEPVNAADSSEQTEHTIKLTRAEFDSLAAIQGKRVRKIRYDYPYKGANAEIAIFQDDLKGLAKEG